MITAAEKVTKAINKLELELQKIQNKCKHLKATFKYKSNTGNYDPSVDCYWMDLKCPTCLKRWSVDGDHEDYRKFGMTLKREKE